MKYKKVSFIGIVLSILLVIGTSAALATSAMPRAAESVANVVAGSAMPELDEAHVIYQTAVSETVLDPEGEAKFYAPYSPFGLVYNKQDQRLYYNGQLVRHFQDMTAFEDGTSTGTINSHADGSIDVYAVREKPVDNLTRGVLIGLKPYTQAEFDARSMDSTKRARNSSADYATDNTAQSSDSTAWQSSVTVSDNTRYEGSIIVDSYASSAPGAVEESYSVDVTMDNFGLIDDKIDAIAADAAIAADESITAASAGWKYLAIFALPDGSKVDLGSFETYVGRYEAVRDYCAYVVREGGMTQAQADKIVKGYM